jgi:sterol desaturase/sphingolipid hydroxylase (fatty acid hydroxylase superfamily)
MLPVEQVFIGFFLLLLLMAYLIPAGVAYGYFYHWRNKHWAAQKIQKTKTPTREIMYRDIRWSLLTIFIFAVLSTVLYYLVNAGYGLMYYAIADYGWIYLPASLFIALILHDFYFYWMHRLMHHPSVFKYVHLQHHKTTAPTPWTIYAFQPLEAIIQYSIIYVLVFILPLHPIVLFTLVAYNVIANVGGHCGFEFTSPKNTDHWLMKYLNTVTHHDLHHANCTHNYSQYFNFLDRWFKTFRES